MATWHLTTKLFTAKCHRKPWRQMGNSSLLPSKCWPLLHVIRACSWRWADIVAFFHWFDPFVLLYNNHAMIGPMRNSKFCIPRISVFSSTLSRETWDFLGSKIHCSPLDQSLSVKKFSLRYRCPNRERCSPKITQCPKLGALQPPRDTPPFHHLVRICARSKKIENVVTSVMVRRKSFWHLAKYCQISRKESNW